MISIINQVSNAPELSEAEYTLLSRVIYERSGIHLGDQKIPLMRARLLKRLRALGISSFRKYYEYVTRNDESGQEMINMLDAISTNLTQFFREPQHFDYLKEVFFSRWKNESEIRILSAGCSTGEEPYSIAITAREYFGELAPKKVRIVAGDISTQVLARARAGLYRMNQVELMPQSRLHSSFLKGTGGCEGLVCVTPELKSMVQFQRLNLIEKIECQTPFHAVFCRNVAIYFEKSTQRSVYQRLGDVMVQHGTLFLGHSESMTSSSCGFRYAQPAVYERM